MTWTDAFLRQAKSDFAVYQEFNRQGKHISNQLHYLQMATEKLAKALLCRYSNRPPKASHVALGPFLKQSKGRVKLREALGYGNNYSSFVAYIDSLLPFAEKIQNLAPGGRRLDQPNPEYPWEKRDGHVWAPIDYTFDDIRLDATNLNKLKTLVVRLMRIANTL